METVAVERLREAGGGAHFDLSDESCPVAIRHCRNAKCGRELRFEFPGGVRPALMGIIRAPLCARCMEEEEKQLELEGLERSVEKRVKESGIPRGLFDVATWDALLEEARGDEKATTKRRLAITTAREWASAPAPASGLYIFGPAGAGKTRLAATIARARLEKARIRWISVGVLMAQLQGAWSDGERQDALKTLYEPGAVVLDDFDKAVPSESVRHFLFTALDKREAVQAPVIVTSNLSPRDLEGKLGDAIASRIVGRCYVVHYPGPDYRLELGVNG